MTRSTLLIYRFPNMTGVSLDLWTARARPFQAFAMSNLSRLTLLGTRL